jgi:hypothetical protein
VGAIGTGINTAIGQASRLAQTLGIDLDLALGLLGQRSAEDGTGPASSRAPTGPSTPPGYPVSPPPLLPPGALTDPTNPPGPNPAESPGGPFGGGDTPSGPPGGVDQNQETPAPSTSSGSTNPAGQGPKGVIAKMLGGSAPDFLEVLKSLQY